MFVDHTINEPRRIIIAVTGASGAIYALRLIEKLCAVDSVGEIALIMTDNAVAVARYEGVSLPVDNLKIRLCRNDDMFDGCASGSSLYDTMIVVPCSMGSLGRIAAGMSADLLGRSADVMLKERRRLILVPRETPLSTIHLRNMTALSECGAVILPASPSFYSSAKTIDQLVMTVVERILSVAGIAGERYVWNARNTPPG